MDLASEKGHEEIVRVLLKSRAYVNQGDDDGCTPLYRASEEGHEEIVRDLLEKGADVNQADNDA